MIHIIWEFRVDPRHHAEFERHYGSDGTWATLFRRSPAYVRTALLHDQSDPDRYVTTDVWTDAEAQRAFMDEHDVEYQELDRAFQALTASEQLLGRFEVL